MVKYAYVTTNLLDLRRRPQIDSERLSQLSFGEVLQTGSTRRGYVKIVQTDGYSGWVDGRFLRDVSQRSALAYRRGVNGVVSSRQAHLYDPESRYAPAPYFLYYGAQLWCRQKRQGLVLCELPDGTSFCLKQSRVRSIIGIKRGPATGSVIAREAKRFLGVPYLWGGISPAGFDCSGLVRTVFGAFGIYIPRDTKDQVKAGTAVDRQEIRAGDLVFFQRHVAIALGRNKIVHSSVGGSGVRINTLTPGEDNYRADLDESYATTRRIL